MWIVFGSGVKARRIPGGAKVERECGQCGETATFYEKEIVATFRLYFVDVFDYQRHRVMACGCCGACYATDELGVGATHAEDGGASRAGVPRASREAPDVGGYLERAADALEAGISSLFGGEEPASPAERPRTEEPAPPVDDEFDELEDPLEARFRELERKAGLRIK